MPPAKRKDLEVRLMEVLNIKFNAYIVRRRGTVEPRASEIIAIESAFAEFGVPKSKVWGPKIGVSYEKAD